MDEMNISIDKILNTDNIAELLSEYDLRNIATQVLDGYEIDKNSRSHREKQIDEATKKALQISKTKSTPWQNASNAIYPLITYSCIEFATTLISSLIEDDKVVKPKIIGADITPVKDEQGNLLPQLDEQGNPVMNEQGNPVPQYQEGLKTARAERLTTHMSYQVLEGMPCWEEDMDRLCHLLPLVGCVFKKIYWDTTLGMPVSRLVLPKNLYINYDAVDVDTAARITEKIELTPNEIEARKRDGRFLDVDFQMPNDSEEKDVPISEQGISYQHDDETTQVFLEQHRWLDIDGDGYEEPYIVTVHFESNTVVRVVKRFTEDGIRYVSEGSNRIAEIKPINYYVKYGFIPSLDGSIYDLGFGELLFHINNIVDTLINQLIDAGTLANMSSGFIGSGLRMKGGVLRTKPGEYRMMPSTGANFRENFIQVQHKEPSAVLFQMLGIMIEAGEKIGSVGRLLNTENTGNMPATTAMAIVDQGIKTHKAIMKRVYRAMKKEFKAIYDLNSMYLDVEEYKRIVDDPQASVEDYNQENLDFVPVADPAIISDMQKATRAGILMEFKDDPLMNGVEIRKRALRAVGITEVDDLVVEPQPPQPNPLDELNAELIKSNIRVNDSIEAKNKASILTDAEKVEIDRYQAASEGSKRGSEALKNVAQAEAAEKGANLKEYETALKERQISLQESANKVAQNKEPNKTQE